MKERWLEPLYRGSVKNLLGPVPGIDGKPAVWFEFTDAYSVFDWGKMPESLPGKGQALALLSAYFFEKLEDPSAWLTLSRTPEALAFRKGNRFGAKLNEWGERLQREGLKTHYQGLISYDKNSQKVAEDDQKEIKPIRLGGLTPAQIPKTAYLQVRQVSVVAPAAAKVLGRDVYDYFPTRKSPAPRLVPLEVVFRFQVPKGSSLPERVERNPEYLAERGFSAWKVEEGSRWDFPVLELFSKLERTDRPIGYSEALAISGVPAENLEEILFKTAWVSLLLKKEFQDRGLELADGKLEWAIDETGQVILADAIGPDELRVLKDGMQLSKEYLRGFYRDTEWFQQVKEAKDRATQVGSHDWKKGVPTPPVLPQEHKLVASEAYWSLVREFLGELPGLKTSSAASVAERMKRLQGGA